MKKKDFILIGIISLFIICFLGVNKLIKNNSEGNIVKIYVNNKLYKKLDLNKESTTAIDIDNKKNVVHIHNKGVEMTDANCPDKICVKSGTIKDSSKDIVCMPHKVQVKIEKSSEKIDAISN